MKRIVLFSGGSGCRAINIALCGKAELTRVVPAWDSGGSSKIIREHTGLLAVGDLRQALMTMAHGEGRAGDVVKICNARLSNNLGEKDARASSCTMQRAAIPCWSAWRRACGAQS